MIKLTKASPPKILIDADASLSIKNYHSKITYKLHISKVEIKTKEFSFSS